MAELATLARPYAKAVFDLAKAQGRLDNWAGMLTTLAGVARADAVRRLLESPDLSDAAKAQTLVRICGEGVDDRGRALIEMLAGNKRLAIIEELRDQFDELKAQEEQVLDVEVVSAYALTEAQADSLREALQRKFQCEVNMTSRVDAGLVGGALIRAGDTVIDGSVRGKLARLAETLQRV
jgi:F-type H+-transporting ATPase subunit delta